MAKPPKKPNLRATRAKASRPDVVPLDEHLAALLNPALNERRSGFAEGPQAPFDAGPLQEIDGELARSLGLDAKHELSGAAATVESLKDLLERGDPNLRAKKPWTPHRPPRPEKSEGGIRFRCVSEYEPKGDQPRRSPNSSRASGAANATRCCSASPAPAKPSPWPR